VATNAIICPYCGRTSPAPGFFTKWIGRIITVIVVVVLIAFVIAIIGNN
jgi:RNA polymerase subunit RPABC4/transcription elongation factor Spt4